MYMDESGLVFLPFRIIFSIPAFAGNCNRFAPLKRKKARQRSTAGMIYLFSSHQISPPVVRSMMDAEELRRHEPSLV